MFREELELTRVLVGLGRDRLVVAAYLGEVVVLEVERELHQGVTYVSGGLIGKGELVLSCSVRFLRAIGLLVDLFLGPEALAFDDDGIDVMEDAVEDGGGQGAVVVEDLRPVLVDAVGGDHHRSALVALADDLEQEVGAELVDG